MGCLKQLAIFDRLARVIGLFVAEVPVPLDKQFTSLSLEQWKNPDCLRYIYGILLPCSYLGVVVNHKDPYQPTNIWKGDVFRGSHVVHPVQLCQIGPWKAVCLSILVVHLPKRCRTEWSCKSAWSMGNKTPCESDFLRHKIYLCFQRLIPWWLTPLDRCASHWALKQPGSLHCTGIIFTICPILNSISETMK